MKWLSGYIIVAVLSVPLSAGLRMAQIQVENPIYYCYYSHRRHLGDVLLLGLLSACIWPVMLPAQVLMTGFAEHGWTLSPPDKSLQRFAKCR